VLFEDTLSALPPCRQDFGDVVVVILEIGTSRETEHEAHERRKASFFKAEFRVLFA
jgi:hypothetical protein